MPKVQNYIVSKATTFVSGKTHTKVVLDKIDIGFPKSILLQGLFLDDLNKDTLVYIKQLEVDIDMLALIQKKVDVNYIGLEGLNGNLVRDKQTRNFNFQFLLDAFSKKEKAKVKVEDTTASPWGIDARKFELKDCRFSLNDSVGGIYLQSSVPTLLINIEKVDLEKKSLEVTDLVVSGVIVKFSKGISIIPDTGKPGTTPWKDLIVENLEVNNTGFSFSDAVQHTAISSKVGHLKLENVNLDLFQQIIRAKNLELAHSNGEIILTKDTVETRLKNSVSASIKKRNWLIEVQNLELDSNNFKLDFANVPRSKKGMDYNHLNLTGLSADIQNIYVNGSSLRSQINKLEVQEQSGFGVRSMKASFEMDSTHANLDGFEIVTNRSRIGKKVNISYSSINKIVDDGQVKISLVDNILSVEDLLVFAPQLEKNKFIAKNTKQLVKLNLEAEGTLKNLLLSKLYLTTGNSTIIDVSGRIKDLRDPKKLAMDLKIGRIQSGNGDLKLLLPDSLIPKSISIPPVFIVKGRHKGGISSFLTNVSLQTSYGNALIVSDIKNVQSDSPLYNLKLTTQRLNLGKLLKQPMLGPLTGDFKLKGTGFKKEKATAELELAVKSVTLQNYAYKNINSKIDYSKGLADILTEINDSNLALTLSGKANIIEGKEAYNLAFKLKGIDLYGLKLTKEHIQVSAQVDADFKGDARDNFQGDMAVRNIMVIKKNKEYRLDSLIVASVNKPGSSSLNMTSTLLSAKFNGNIDLLVVASAVENHLNKYFNSGPKPPNKPTQPQNFDFEVKINEDPFIREVLFPSLNNYNAVTIKGAFDSQQDILNLALTAPLIEYGKHQIKDFRANIISDKQKLNYDFGLSNYTSGSFQLSPTSFNGSVADNKILMNLLIADKKNGSKLALQSLLARNGQYYRYSLLPDGFKIMDHSWVVDVDNYIEFGKKHLYVHKFTLSNGKESINANSSSNTRDADLLLNIKDFQLKTLSQIMEQKDSLFKGTVNGTITLKDYQQKPAFTSDLKLTDLQYKTSKVGDLAIKAGNINSAKYNVNAVLSGMGNNVVLAGYYNPLDTAHALDFTADINALQLSSLESFTSGNIRKSSGFITGNFKIEGNTVDPKIDGKLNFLEAKTNVKFLNQTLYMQNESISFSKTGLHFNSFHIRDTLNNMATVEGDVKMHQFKDIHFDMQVTSDKFMVLNTTAIDNKLFYGKVILDSDIKIKGTPDLPKITAYINVANGSRFTFAVPESKLSVDRGEGVVVFLYDPENLHPIMLRREKRAPNSKVLKGMDLTAHVKVHSGSTLKILVDPASGDSLVVKGDADLNLGIDPSGKTSLSGIYTISSGKYKAFIEGITTKEFFLVKGSKIVWSGDPLDAQIDIQAQYNIKTTARELMSIGGSGTAVITDSSALGRPLPFEVILIMEGELLKPTLSFRLDMADNQKSVAGGAIYAKLNEVNEIEAERNKQVFSLLVLSKFMSSNAPGGGTTSSGLARSSVSRMMSDQLNQLSSQYLKGVEVNVDLQSYDYNQGGGTKSNTQANVSVKKSFDRLSVQVGSNVKLEGSDAQQSNAKSFTGDVEVAYKLTKDGRYQAKAFRQNEVDAVANGVITETGAGIVYTRNYNKTRELLKPPVSRRNKRKEKQLTK
ncbi:MAG: translocation/assembly module TamB domain-containing protein [Opitutaceae bacterium]|nr:translocation/assembly module TamB domain-containing protein [Cytophagales bacterium]